MKVETTAKTASRHLRAFADWVDSQATVSERRKISQWLNDMLDELVCEDAFGTEAQCDPRGDPR